MRPSLPRLITMNFNHPRTHLHHLRELIPKFQALDRDPSGHNYNGHRYSFIWSCPKEDLSFEGTKRILTTFPETTVHSHHPMLSFNTPLYQIGSRIPTRINSTSSSTLDYCFEARIWSISSIGHCDRSRTFWVYSFDRKIQWCIESTFDLSLKSRSRLRLDCLLLFL